MVTGRDDNSASYQPSLAGLIKPLGTRKRLIEPDAGDIGRAMAAIDISFVVTIAKVQQVRDK